MVHSVQRILICVAAALSMRCASGRSHGCVQLLQGESYPKDPFRLQVRVAPSEIVVGQPLTIEYTLTNTSDQAVAACADGWSDFYVRGTHGDHGHSSASLDALRPEMVFRVPPHASIVWRADVRFNEVGLGPATLRGTLQSSCSLWSGSVVSDAVQLTIRPPGD